MRTFDEIYASVPAEQREELHQFRRTHPESTHVVNGVTWRYIASGAGDQVLLLLVGGLREADAAYRNIPLLEDDFRVIAPSYPALNTMAELADGIAGVLQHESVQSAHVLAGSFGGMLAQVFVRRHRAFVDKLVLSTTAVLDEASTGRYRQGIAMIDAAPEDVVMENAKETMFTIMQPPEAMHDFYRAYLDELYSYRVDKAALASTYHALLDFADNYTLMPDDLAGWPGAMLILEADDDATFDAQTRERVRALYPQAERYVFHNAGHSPAASQRDLYFKVVKDFLLER
jgi:pimeloyl-ACP methyl ester carboxylesterase